MSFAFESFSQIDPLTYIFFQPMRRIVTHTEYSMAVLPSSICKLKKARGGGLLRTNSNGSGRKGGEDDEDDHYRSEMEDSDNTESPPEPLPLYQQRENYFT